MNDFQSHSQAGQDAFAFYVCGRKNNGTFLDLGCGDPVTYNNTFALEQAGWIGWLFDRYPDEQRAQKRRSNNWVEDLTKFDWNYFDASMPNFGSGPIDYLSLDCDENSFAVLENLMRRTPRRFRCITIEHDTYLRGRELCYQQRTFLGFAGYILICADVLWEGKPFEDWYVDPALCDKAIYDDFVCEGMNGLDIIRDYEALRGFNPKPDAT